MDVSDGYRKSSTAPCLTRRTVLKRLSFVAAGAAAGRTVLRPASGQETQGEGGLVWLDMTQAQLDAAYDQSVYAPNMEHVIRRRSAQNEAALERLGEPLRYAYGSMPIEGLDVYVTDRPNAPINVFIHGGAWQRLVARESAYVAEPLVRNGAHCVVPDYSWVQDVDGNLSVLGDQVRRAVAWVYRNAELFGGDPERIYVSGHSAGGHLAAVVLTTDWQGEFSLPVDIVKGGLCSSGMYDMEPVRLSSRREYVNFTHSIEHVMSPQRHVDKLNAKLIVSYGTLETPEFQRQAREFAATVRAAAKPVEVVVGQGYNHFEIEETFANPFGLLGYATLKQMGLLNAL